jgi:hypothetical protein
MRPRELPPRGRTSIADPQPVTIGPRPCQPSSRRGRCWRDTQKAVGRQPESATRQRPEEARGQQVSMPDTTSVDLRRSLHGPTKSIPVCALKQGLHSRCRRPGGPFAEFAPLRAAMVGRSWLAHRRQHHGSVQAPEASRCRLCLSFASLCHLHLLTGWHRMSCWPPMPCGQLAPLPVQQF